MRCFDSLNVLKRVEVKVKVQFPRKSVLWLLAVAFVCSNAMPSEAQTTQQREEMQQRAQESFRQERLQAFIEDVHRFYETSGELVSFRVQLNMSPQEAKSISDKSKELDNRANRIIDFIENAAPAVKGNTDDLWIIRPPSEEPTLEERLTLILALVYRVEPKLQHLIELIGGEVEPAIELEQLMVEVSLPYLVVGGLQTIKSMTIDLRQGL